MPKETIASTTKFATKVEGVEYPADEVPYPEGAQVANTRAFDLAVGWSPAPKAVPWVQINVIPLGWQSTGDWISFDMDPDQIDHLIRTLRRVKRKVYRRSPLMIGLSDPPAPEVPSAPAVDPEVDSAVDLMISDGSGGDLGHRREAP